MIVLVSVVMVVANLCISLGDCPVTPPPPIADAPIVITYYDPSLGGINCGGSCDTLADGTKWNASHYNNTAACLIEWRGAVVVVSDWRLRCRDSGSMVALRWNTYYERWVVHVDILAPSLLCNYCLYETWRLEWN